MATKETSMNTGEETSRTRGNYHHGDLASALIDATISLLAKQGPESISLREVARTAGVSHGAPAYHFGSKAGLLLAVAIDGHRLLARALSESINSKHTPTSRLIAAGEAYIHFAIGHPGHFSIMFQSEQIDRQSPEYLQAIDSTLSQLQACVKALVDVPDDTSRIDAIVTALWSQVHGFSMLWMAGNFGDPDDDTRLHQLLSDVLRGLTPKLSSE